MSNYSCYEPILNRNLQELRLGNKDIKKLKKIKIFDSDALAEKLQKLYRYEPNYAIESVKFSYNGYHTRSKYVQELWQTELRLYNNSQFARKPAHLSIYAPTAYDCYLDNPNEYFTEQPIDELVETLQKFSYDYNASYDEILNCVKKDIIKSFMDSITSSISYISQDRANNGKLVVLSLLPIRYDENCPYSFSAIQNEIQLINRQVQTYCAQKHIQFVDIFPYFADKDGLLREDLSDDGIFLNETGNELLTTLSTRIIEQNSTQSGGSSEVLPH